MIFKISYRVSARITGMIFLTFLVFLNATFARSQYSQRLYCKMQGQSARVYLRQEEGTHKCSEYRSAIGIKMRGEYADLNQITVNRNRGDDIAYRNSLYHKKLETFMLAYSQYSLLEQTIKDFEEKMLLYFHEYIDVNIQKTLDTYSVEREKLLANIIDYYSWIQQNRLTKIDKLLSHIKTLQTTNDIDDFLFSLDQYLILTSALTAGK